MKIRELNRIWLQCGLSDESPILCNILDKINLSKLQHEADENNSRKYKELVKLQAVSKKEAEEKILCAEKSFMELSNLKKQYISTKNELKNSLLSAELQLANISQQYSENVIRSNMSGIVYSILKEEGDIVTTATPILLIGSENQYKLELMVDECDISKIENGQKVLFEPNTDVTTIYEATVSKINPVLLDESRSFKIEASIDSKFPFYPKSTVEASIIIRENVSALLAPLNYFINSDTLLTESNEKISVKRGVRIGNWIEVTKGISNGDKIIKPSDNENN